MSSSAPTRPNSGFDRIVAEAGFVLLLLLIFVGTTPLDDRSVASLAARNATSASGDLIRQVSFLGTFAIILFAALRKRGLAAIRATPPSLALLMGWCILSAVWAAEPDIVGRRAVLATIFVLSMMLSVDTLGTARAIVLWRYVVAAVIIADLASVALFQNAIHLPSDVEANLAGAWRGLHSHKNTAGAFAATSAIMFFYFAIETKRRSDILLCAASILFLVMTRSKSSLGLLAGRADRRRPLPHRLAQQAGSCHCRRRCRAAADRSGRRAGCAVAVRGAASRGSAEFHGPRGDLAGRVRLYPRSSAVSAPDSARSATPARARRSTTMSAAAGSRRSARAIAAISKCS